jgi:hypothetical protein
VTQASAESGATTEAIGVFADLGSFETAVGALTAAGFTRTDLSVLASHESIDAAGKPEPTWKEVLTALVGEVRYEGPLVASGAVFLAGGPVAAAIAAIIGTAVGGIAVKELLEEVAAKPHTLDFARSLAAGSVILWVRAETPERQATAMGILASAGGTNVHLHPTTDHPA